MSHLLLAMPDTLSHVEAIASVISALVAIAAVVGASVVSWKVAKRQLEVTTKLANDQMELSWKTAQLQMGTAQKVAIEQRELSLIIAKHQIIAPMRQAWIDKLRSKLAKLIGLISEYVRLAKIDERHKFDTQEYVELVEEIRLLLHRGEPDHDLLVERLGAVLKAIIEYHKSKESPFPPIRPVTDIAQKILKDEWETTKRLEDKIENLKNTDSKQIVNSNNK